MVTSEYWHPACNFFLKKTDSFFVIFEMNASVASTSDFLFYSIILKKTVPMF